MSTTKLKIEGMNCVSCERTIGNALKKVPGVEEASVSIDTAEAVVKGSASTDNLIKAVQSAGYEAYPIHRTGEENKG